MVLAIVGVPQWLARRLLVSGERGLDPSEGKNCICHIVNCSKIFIFNVGPLFREPIYSTTNQYSKRHVNLYNRQVLKKWDLIFQCSYHPCKLSSRIKSVKPT